MGEGIVSSATGVWKVEDGQVREGVALRAGLHQLSELGCLPTYKIQLNLLMAGRNS